MLKTKLFAKGEKGFMKGLFGAVAALFVVTESFPERQRSV